ncbi:MAG: hypothetical protein FWG16_02110 [Micrococcales bacterium]|nr:hypothetical protein [Micrococcales bacterium]
MARHLVMAGDLLEKDPELAYRHARAAADRAGRVDVAREYAGLTSYFTDRFAEVVRELRTFQRLSGTKHHSALLADSLRALGQINEAVDLATSVKASEVEADEWFELVIVLAGARADQAQFDAALALLTRLRRGYQEPDQVSRLDEAQSRIEALADGRLVEDEVESLHIPKDGVIGWTVFEEETDQDQPVEPTGTDPTDSTASQPPND